jgi:predicted alpha/beta superfamily hydrolase
MRRGDMIGLRRGFLLLLVLLVSACSTDTNSDVATTAPAPAAVVAPAIPAPYSIADTQVLDLSSKSLGRDYQLYVALPESYADAPERTYPVVFVTDAPYAFPLVRAISRRVGDHGAGLEEFILVGLSYAKGDTPAASRRRDYTPTAFVPPSVRKETDGPLPVHGEAAAYARFIADEVFPLVARTYRADMSRKVFAGHSYGSLLGAHILFTEPAMFEHYILGSPSLWFDHGVMFARERDYAKAHADLPADVFLGIGAYETSHGASGDPRFDEEGDMVGDMRRFEATLASRKYPGLHLGSAVFDGEDHLTVAPIIITHGLLRMLPPVEKTQE